METKRILPFQPLSKSVVDQLDPGWMRRACLTFPTYDPKNPLQIESYVWMDSKLVGFVVSDDFLGTANGTTTRMKGGKTVELSSFLAQRMHTTS